MKRVYNIILMIIVSFLTLGCNNKTPEIATKPEPKISIDSMFRKQLTKPLNDKIYLLAYKDGLSDTVVRKIVFKYLEMNDPFDYYVLTKRDNDSIFGAHISEILNNGTQTVNMKSLLDTISINFKVSNKKAAQVIFDYKLLQSFEDIKEKN